MKRLLVLLSLLLLAPPLAPAQVVCSGIFQSCTPLLSGATLTGTTTIAPSGRLLLPDGAASTPALAFQLEPGLGIFRSATNFFGIMNPGYSTSAVVLSIAGNGPRVGNAAGYGFASTVGGDGALDLTLQRGGTSGALRILSGTTPTQSGTTCGTGPTITGNNSLGSVTLGTAPGLPCTIVFNGTWTNAPKCFLDAEVLATATTTVRATGITTTQFVITSTAALVATDKVSWLCVSN